MFPILIIAIGLVVLAFGNRLPVLGAAVGALVGVAVLHIFSISVTDDPWLALAIPGVLAAVGFFLTAFTAKVVDIVLLVLGALAGAAIVLAFLDLFNINNGLIDWILAVAGGAVGLVLVRRFKRGALVVLAGLVGGLLVTRGLTVWLPALEGTLGTLLVLALAGGGVAYQGGYIERRRAAAQARTDAEASSPAAPAAPAAPTAPPTQANPPSQPAQATMPTAPAYPTKLPTPATTPLNPPAPATTPTDPTTTT